MINKSVNNFSKGLNTSEVKAIQPKDTYSYALNAIKDDSTNNPSILQNEKGFSAYINLGYQYTLVGYIWLGKEDYILFVKHPKDSTTLFNRVILVENKIPTVKFDTLDLNFQDKYIIRGTYRINYKNQRIIYWVDGLNEDRVLNIDNNTVSINVDILTIDIKYVAGILQSKVINDDNGALRTGTYEFFASYKSEDNATTPWFLLNANPVYIIKDSIENQTTSNYINITGVDSNVITSKSITLNLSNLDTNFKKLRIGVIKTINGAQVATYIDDISYDGNTKSYDYTGFAEETTLASISEFLVDKVKYFASNAITQSGGRLLRANTKQSKINIDYQFYANNIITDYYVDEEQVLEMEDTTDDNARANWWKSAVTKYTDKKSLMRDEVYSVGVAFGLKKEGIETEVYHIPGRALNSIPTTTYESEYLDDTHTFSNWDSEVITENGETLPRWKVKNTAAKSTDGLVNKPGYWESTEVYPAGYKLPVGFVRHHKMPSSGLEPIYRSEKTAGKIKVYKRNLGLKFSNIKVPDTLKDNVAYIRFYITPRNTEKNKSIVAKGAFTNCTYTKINTANNVPSDNYYIVPIAPYGDGGEPMNDATFYFPGDPQGKNNNYTSENYYHSFFSPDTLFKKPALNADRVYIENEIDGTVYYFNTVADKISVDPTKKNYKDTPNNINGGYKRDIFYDTGNIFPVSESQTSSGDVYNVKNTFRSTYKSMCIFNDILKVPTAKSRRYIKKAAYVPFNAQLSTDQLGGMDNPYYSPFGTANILVELDPVYNILGNTTKPDTSVQFTDNNKAYQYPDDSETKGKTIKGTFHFHPRVDATAVYRYGSLKRNNPSQYGTILGLEYAPTDLVIANPTFTNNLLTTEVKGLVGDTWIDLFSLKRIRYGAKKDYTYGSLPEVHVGISSFFTESTVNHRLRYTHDGESMFPQIGLSQDLRRALDYSNKDVVEKDNTYTYNEDFTKISSKRNYSPDDIDKDTLSITDYSTRIVYSEKLLDEARIDAYRTFLANNYKDLPKNKGFITHLFNKSQELYAITRDSIWKLFASNETIKSTSDSNITVGTGEFLGLDPVELISIDGGYAGSSSKLSLVETPYGYFYIDRYKGKFILFADGLEDISLKDINSFIIDNFKLTNINENIFDSPLLDQGYVVGYDNELKRILITKLEYNLLSQNQDKYKGEYDANATYSIGDIYLRNGKYYEFQSKNQSYKTIIESSTLSDFKNSGNDGLVYTTSTPAKTLTRDGKNNLVYTSDTVGTDSFNITMGCSITPVTINTLDAPLLPDYTTSIYEKSANNTAVITVNGNYTGLTYSIIAGNELGIYAIDNTGKITVVDNTSLVRSISNQEVLTVRAQSGSIYDDGKVTINVLENISTPIGIDKTITILNTAVGQITTLDKAIWEKQPFPTRPLIYSTTDVGAIFISDIDDENNMTVSVKDGVVLDPSTMSPTVITYKVEDSGDSTRFDTFTLTINIIYDPAQLVAEPYEYTCVVEQIAKADYIFEPYPPRAGVIGIMRPALDPLNTVYGTYAFKNTTTRHYVYSLHFLFYDQEGSSYGTYYEKNAFGDHVIARLSNPDVYPDTTIPLYGYARGLSIGGYITPNGEVHLNKNDGKAIFNCSGHVSNEFVMRLYNIDYTTEFKDDGRGM